jgi:putative transposase
MSHTSGSHMVFHHRYHIVRITKYRDKVLEGALRERTRTIIRQVCKELGVQIVSGILSREHVPMLVENPVTRLPPSSILTSAIPRISSTTASFCEKAS